MKEYIALGKRILNDGVWVTNERTGKRCLTVIDANLEYNTKENKLPLITTRKAYYKSAFAELLGYLQGLDNSKDFQKLGTPTWNDNANVSTAWVNNPNRKDGDGDMGLAYRFRESSYFIPYKNKYEKDYIQTPEKLINEVDLENIPRMKNIETPSQVRSVALIIEHQWLSVLNSIFDSSGRMKNNLKIKTSWYNVNNFVRDFFKIKNWHLKLLFPDDYNLSNTTFNSCTLDEFSGKFMTKTEIDRNLENKDKTYVSLDQFREVYSKLYFGISDRRLIMTAWQPHSEAFQCLPACMHTHTFSILGGELHLTSYQRSIDVPLGLAFNMPQTVFLLHIMARITGYKPGMVYHKLIDCHIYEDQVDLFKEQMEREPYALPTFKISDKLQCFDDIYKLTKDDVSIAHYNSHPAIAYPMSS